MKTKLTKILALIAIVASYTFSTFSLVPTYAADPVCDSSVSDEVKKAAGCPDYNTGNQLRPVVVIILNSIIGISGFVAVIFIIVGGVSYMTSSGDFNKLKKAKDTILYAVVGMLICILAFAIVNWVIAIIGGGTSS